jgi:hypothetical protein
MIAVFAAIFHNTHPAFLGFQALPHVLIHEGRHVRVPDNVMRAANQLFPGETADGLELIVAVKDFALGIRSRYESLRRVKISLMSRQGEIFTHCRDSHSSRLKKYHWCCVNSFKVCKYQPSSLYLSAVASKTEVFYL